MTFHNDKEIKEKWLKRYKDEILINKEKRDYERENRIKEERENIEIDQRLMEEEKQNQIKKKQEAINVNMEEYYKFLEKKKEEIQKHIEGKKEAQEVSLDIKNEERVNMLKERINHLGDIVEKNMNNYIKYTNQPRPFSVNRPKLNNQEDSYKDLNETQINNLKASINNKGNGYNQNLNNFPNTYNTSNLNNVRDDQYRNINNVSPLKGHVRTDVTNHEILEKVHNKNYQEFKNVNYFIKARFKKTI